MNLKILQELHAQIIGNEQDILNIQQVHMYSKYVTNDSLFIAMNDQYIDEAIEKGAIVILTTKIIMI